jgi:hypothetical protein
MANGWNNSTWGALAWSGIQNSTVQVTSPCNDTWGALSWGQNAFGGTNTLGISQNSVTATPNSLISVTGLQLNTSLNSVAELITVDVFLTNTNLLLGTSVGNVDVSPDAIITGQQLNLSTGTLLAYNRQGWGRFYWGEEVWGDSGIWETVSVTGQQLNLTLNSVTPIANANVDVIGQQLNVSEGIVDPSPDATVVGIGMTVALAVGTVIAGDANTIVTGQRLNIAQGTAIGDANTIASVTGIGLISSVGTVFAGGTSIIIPTGIGLTIALNSINNQIWTEINTGTDATWTEIDTAA